MNLIHAVIFYKAIGSKLGFYGNVTFINNNAEGVDGGAIYMVTFSQMILNSGAHLKFINNTGGYVTSNVHTVCIYSHNLVNFNLYTI